MATTKNHSQTNEGSRHAPHNLTYPNAANRIAGTNEGKGITVTAANLYQWAKQDDDDSLWMLTSVSPITWVQNMMGSDANLDSGYGAFGTNPANVVIDNAEGQGDLVFSPTGAFSLGVDLASTTGTVDGFQIYDGVSTEYFRLIRKADNSIDLETALNDIGLDAAGDFSLKDQYLSSAISLSESGETALVGYTATSLVGGLNEVKQADGISVETIGTPTTDNVQTMISCGFSAGIEADTPLSDAGGATIDISAGEGFIRTSNSNMAPLKSVTWAANSGVAIPTDTIRYAGVEYNGGSPQTVIRSSDNFNGRDEFRMGSVVNEGGTLHIINNPQVACDPAREVFHRLFETRPIERAERVGGLINSETGTRELLVTAGEFYDGVKEFSIPAFDSSGADTFDMYYRDGVGGFTKVAAQTQWSNSQYDDNSGTLQSISVNDYVTHWVYLELDGGVVVLYSQGQYNTEAEAIEATPPASVPLRVQSHGRLIGKIIQGQGDTNATDVQSVYAVTFGASAATNHNELSGLQGGAVGDYYHLTGTNAGYIDQDVTSGASPTFGLLKIDDGSDSSNYVFDTLSMGHDTVTDTSWIQSAGAAAGSTLALNPEGGDIGIGSNLAISGNIVMELNKSIANNASLYGGIEFRNFAQTKDSVFLFTGTVANSITICEQADRIFDFAHSTQTNPTLFIHSANQATDEWISLTHVQTGAVIDWGAGNLNLPGGNISVGGLILGNEGTNIASAGNMAAPDANYCTVTGTTTINTMATTNITTGTIVTLKFAGALTLKNQTAGTGAQFYMQRTALDLTVLAGDVYTFVYDGTYWVAEQC